VYRYTGSRTHEQKGVLVMYRLAGVLTVAVLSLFGCAIQVPGQSGSAGARGEALYWETVSPTFGSDHLHGHRFADPEAVISQGPITKVEVHSDSGGYIRGIRLTYGRSGVGNFHGYRYGEAREWQVPDGEKIVRVEGAYGRYLTRLQFFTDGGHRSPAFGRDAGTHFTAVDPSGGALRTISGWANTRKHSALWRALVNATFHFGAPYFIKDIQFDEDALEAAKLKAAPYQIARMALPNRTSVVQEVTYAQKRTVSSSKTMTFEQSFGLTFGQTISAHVGGSLKALDIGVESEMKWEMSSSTTFGHSYTNETSQEVS
jgi:hypothetical protein